MAAKSEGPAFETLFTTVIDYVRTVWPAIARGNTGFVCAGGTGDCQAKLESEILGASAEIKRLNEDLEESRNNKRHKIAYDEIATEANKLPTRERLSTDISAIASEIEQLEQEEEAHDAVLESLRAQYSTALDEMRRLESMSKNALSMQDLGIYMGDSGDTEGDRVGGHLSMGISPTTPHQPGESHDDFGTPIDDPMLNDDDGDHGILESRLDKSNGDEEDDIEDGEDSGHDSDRQAMDGPHSARNINDIDSEEEGEYEDEEGELTV
ncbi:hypothetical protein IW140_002824 [Coemansia sp. RSA 1813]|nr:hypothetical protein IW138_003153 [Coemansia sp. RSA 986]KAJ2569743.1 hypothetical protein IW140_002824 [Coemansia sp. RSA 1813]